MSIELIDYLKVAIEKAGGLTDVLLQEWLHYILWSAVLHCAVVGIVFGILFSALGRGLALLKGTDQGSILWNRGFRVARVALVVGTILYSYNSVHGILRPLLAPHVFLMEQGLSLLNK